MLMMICAKYDKNASRIVDFFLESLNIRKICKKLKFQNFVINLTCDTPSNGSDYLYANMSGHDFQSQGRMTLKI